MSDEMEILGITGARDERGLVSITVPYLATTLEGALQVGSPPVASLQETTRTFRAGPSGHFEVEVTFEGGRAGENDEERQEKAQYSATASYREEPIESHPKIKELIKKYNGSQDTQTFRVTFPPELETTGGTNPLATEGAAPAKRNPMAGVEKYMALELVWRRSSVLKQMPKEIFNRVGTTTNAPPGGPPRIAGRHAWLIMPPSVKQRGMLWELDEEWTLLPEGAPTDVYDL
jgi:hypothetical protein